MVRCVKLAIAVGSTLVTLQTQAVNFTPLPPYLTEIKGAPMIMLNMSRDHQLFYKAYNDYSDLDADGLVETQYKHSYKYYGYFDNQRCYTYDTGNHRYAPIGKVDALGYCTDATAANRWNGNFMNWATTSRMDVVRKILYGGFRAQDTPSAGTPSVSLTVLERAHLPSDAHAFAKYYYGADINKLTPFDPAATTFTLSTGTGTVSMTAPQITLCNASFGNAVAPAATPADAPSIYVANGNHALWSANAQWQCYWREDKDARNGNKAEITGLAASTSNPSRDTDGLGTGYKKGSYTARVEVCKTSLTGGFTADEDARCKLYPRGNYQPIGLLQRYGERDEAAFGLMTGSFDKNLSGGVLRKNVASFKDEVNLDDGTFFKNVDGVVQTLNRLKVTGYNYDSGNYGNAAGTCTEQSTALKDGQCPSWGNTIGETYLESVRYFAGKTPTPGFTSSPATNDTALGLKNPTWADPSAPTTRANFGDETCRRTSIVNFSSSVISFDSDQWSSAADITGSTTAVDNYTNDIGKSEGLYELGKLWSVGRNGVDNNGFCSDKSIAASGTSSFANITGICPEAPTQYGGYKMTGLALWSRLNRVRTDIPAPVNNTRAFKIDTYSVALNTGSPRIRIPVPGQAGKFVFISPSYRLGNGLAGGGGTLVDFKVVYQTATKGKYIIIWDDSEQGGDFDQDMLGILEYSVEGAGTRSPTLRVTTDVLAESTSNPQGFGYAISGTSQDGVHFHSGIHGFSFVDPRNIKVEVSASPTLNITGGCNSCQVGDAATTAEYSMVGVSGEALKDPLWYAAKYGGLTLGTSTYTPGATPTLSMWDVKGTDGTTGADGIPDKYFYAVDPSQFEKSLSQVFDTILKTGGAAPAASPKVGGFIYQSAFDIKAKTDLADAQAGGKFERFSFLPDGRASTLADWDAGEKLTAQDWRTGRKILSLSSAGPIVFRWANLSIQQQDALKKNQASVNTYDSAAAGENKLNWLRGDRANESVAGGLRVRSTTTLGAIVNSTPWVIGPPAAGYTESDYDGGYKAFKNTNTATHAVFVAANDGMLHAFNADSGNELFAYVPRAMYRTTTVAPFSPLSALTEKDFALNNGTGRMTVDGSVMAADMKVGATPAWATYLFGTFGRGGKGVYALDVTRPHEVIEDSTSANKLIKWEFSEETGDPDMGFITGTPSSRANGQPFQTGRMANGKWAAIYGNGYNSSNEKAVLYILYADGPVASSSTWTTGTHYIKIPTGPAGVGPDNGLGMPTAIDSDNDGNIDTIYAGDLKGNVWKFDVRDVDPNKWKVATTDNLPLYQARSTLTGSATVVVQPITTVVQAFPHPNGGYLLAFGTGKTLQSSDYPLNAPFINTIYGIYDKPGNTTSLTAGLSELAMKATSMVSNIRYIENTPVDYSTKKGWYLNLPLGSEALVFNPLAQSSGRILFKSIAPDGAADGCRVNSISFTMELNPITGNAIANPVEGAAAITGFIATGTGASNSFEVGRAGVYRLSTPLGGSCLPGDPKRIDNPKVAGEYVCCDDPAICCPPWKACETCVYRTLSALGTGGVATALRYGSCGDGRLTWREILRNR